MDSVFESLVDVIGGETETSTITIKMIIPIATMRQGVVAASRLIKKDQESEFLSFVVNRTGFLNMKLIDFDVEP